MVARGLGRQLFSYVLVCNQIHNTVMISFQQDVSSITINHKTFIDLVKQSTCKSIQKVLGYQSLCCLI